MLLLLHTADEEFSSIKRSSGCRQPFISSRNHDDDDHRSWMMLMEGKFCTRFRYHRTDSSHCQTQPNTRNKMTDSQKAGKSNVSSEF
ncbi:hypothetical protein I315_02646 [Cryptococcus gattii Ru294]|uniref:Uncharacterized protein n=2 Tax=Cryptococcus gattii TaxID=37769 RepID=E6R9R3_CRYGW|nr:Hypothetical Protein CGB_G4650C [Cryptococcus gattii WM276]KIR54765.1 hypothetical protein I315_02646 [Cryptococcus gattii Ru294]KIR77652.1 hypothetical protein I306_05388 [Cryptococcus gattii EJB2]KIY35958.1 hypothetical protein I305_01534 [Cryptococcus gattii E566]KJE05456.1 hypothetical protein I311_00662 [Cryptococcus gattii NT-10]ADV23537.1 Hypothetical Protein CGB_G4650C [Cryptococcus gattii WM276]